MGRHELIEEELTQSAIGAFYEAYNTLGFGFVEHVYVMALEHELRQRGHSVGREVGVRIRYKGFELCQQRLDMVVDEKLVIEVKAAYKLDRHATRQTYNYLRATDLEVGLLLHFGPEPAFYRIISRNNKGTALSSAESASSGRDIVMDASRPLRRRAEPGQGRILPDRPNRE